MCAQILMGRKVSILHAKTELLVVKLKKKNDEHKKYFLKNSIKICEDKMQISTL